MPGGPYKAYGDGWGRVGDVVSCELDLDKRRIRWRLNGTWFAYDQLLGKTGAYSFGFSMRLPGSSRGPASFPLTVCVAVFAHHQCRFGCGAGPEHVLTRSVKGVQGRVEDWARMCARFTFQKLNLVTKLRVPTAAHGSAFLRSGACAARCAPTSLAMKARAARTRTWSPSSGLQISRAEIR